MYEVCIILCIQITEKNGIYLHQPDDKSCSFHRLQASVINTSATILVIRNFNCLEQLVLHIVSPLSYLITLINL